MVDPLELRLIALEIAKEAGEVAVRRRREGVTIAASKTTLADIVTEADREVESLIARRLTEMRPDDGFLGEESGVRPGASGVTWVVDPIDGTVNYAYGIPTYAMSIAAVTGDADPLTWSVQAGVVYNPAVGEIFDAAAGEGARLDGSPIRVADRGEAGALIATGFGYDRTTHAAALDEVARFMPLARDVRRAGAASLDLAYVAAGRLDAYAERGLKPWDLAAGVLLVAEAGGAVEWGGVDEHGRRLLVASSGELTTELRRRIEPER